MVTRQRYLGLRLIRLLAVSLSIPAASPAMAGEDEFQSWNTVQFSFSPGERLELGTMVEGRLLDDASQLRHRRVGQLVTYALTETIGVGINFRHTRKESASGAKSSENRWELALYHSIFKSGRWRADFRHRVEQIRSSVREETMERSRHRLRFRRAVDGLAPLTQMYATFEAFYGFNESRLAETRWVPFGMTFSVGEQSRLSTAYMLRSVRRGGDWERAHVVELSLAVSL
jgi:hypothetical protein